MHIWYRRARNCNGLTIGAHEVLQVLVTNSAVRHVLNTLSCYFLNTKEYILKRLRVLGTQFSYESAKHT